MKWKVNEVNPVDLVERIHPGYRTTGRQSTSKKNSVYTIDADKMMEDWLNGKDVDKYFEF